MRGYNELDEERCRVDPPVSRTRSVDADVGVASSAIGSPTSDEVAGGSISGGCRRAPGAGSIAARSRAVATPRDPELPKGGLVAGETEGMQAMPEKRSTGPNARPKDETIAQTGEGLPDDSGGVPQDVEEAEVKAARRSLDRLEESGKANRHDTSEDESDSGEDDRPGSREHKRQE